MAQFKFSQEAKQVFIDCYNNPEIPSINLHKEITLKLHKGGFLQPNVELSKELVREALENKLQLVYRKRPRKKSEEISISFEGDEVTVVDTEEVAEEPQEDDLYQQEDPVNQWESRQNPVKFEF